MSLLTLAIYVYIVYVLLFKTEWLIAKLHLTANLSDEPLVLNIHRSTIYTIAIVVSGIVILAFAIPQFVRDFYEWYNYLDTGKRGFRQDYFDYGRLFTSSVEVIIGFTFLGNQRTLVNFIESRRRNANATNADRR